MFITQAAQRSTGCGLLRKACSKAPIVVSVLLTIVLPARAQGDPWTTAAQNLQIAFTGPIAKGLALVAIVVGGLGFAFGEAGSKRALAGIVFGVGMAISAASFLSWLFGG